MKKRNIIAIAIVLSVAVCFPMKAEAADKPVSWVFQAFDGKDGFTYGLLVELAERIRLTTGGKVLIEIHPLGAYMPTLKVLDGVKLNVIDGALAPMIMWSDKIPVLGPLCDLFAAYTHPWEKLTWLYHKGGMELANEALAPLGLFSIGVFPQGVESLVSTKPLRNPEDLKGLVVRMPGGTSLMLFEKLGAKPLKVPPEQIAEYLKNNMLDVADLGTLAHNDKAGFYDIEGVKHTNYPGFHSMPTLDLIVNKEQWEKLPEDIRKTIELTVRGWSWDVAVRGKLLNYQAVQKVRAKGVTLYEWRAEDVNNVRAAAVGVWDEWAKKSPLSKKVVESQKAWLKELGLLQ